MALGAPPSDLVYETYWTNGAPVSLAVTKGLYAVLLGDTSLPNMTALPAQVFDHEDVRLRVWSKTVRLVTRIGASAVPMSRRDGELVFFVPGLGLGQTAVLAGK